MLGYRRENERGISNYKGIISKHSFSFNRYYNQNFLSLSDLRVINQDILSPSCGFDLHAHNNQEIITLVIDGQLIHKDSIGNEMIINAGEIALMSAGAGISHSEFNASNTKDAHFLQIWITPNIKDGDASYQKAVIDYTKETSLVISNNIEADLLIKQECEILIYNMPQKSISIDSSNNYYWLQIISGSISHNNDILSAGDGLYFYNENMMLSILEDNTKYILFKMNIPK